MKKRIVLLFVCFLGLLSWGCCVRYTRLFVTEGTPKGLLYSLGKIDTLGGWRCGLGSISVWREGNRDLVEEAAYSFRLQACHDLPADTQDVSYAELRVDSILVRISPEMPAHVLHLARETKELDPHMCSGSGLSLYKFFRFGRLHIPPEVDTIWVRYTARSVPAGSKEEATATFTTRMYRVNRDIRYLQCWIPLD